jgi:hypothetical protein
MHTNSVHNVTIPHKTVLQELTPGLIFRFAHSGAGTAAVITI